MKNLIHIKTMKTDHIDAFGRRLKKLGIQVELVANYPWIYLDKVNGETVKGKYLGNHGFTAFFLTNDKDMPYKITDTKIVFAKVREMIQNGKEGRKVS